MEEPEISFDHMLGLLRIRVKKGVDLVVRDVVSSDPYAVVKMGKQKLKTRVIKKDVNPEWDEDLTLSVIDPSLPVTLTVYDHDTFTMDDPMGEAEIDIKPFLGSLKMKADDLPDGTVITKMHPDRHNCLAEDSDIVWKNGEVTQEMCLRLKHVESGEIHLQLHWIPLPPTN